MQATAVKYNNHINNRLGISGFVLNLVQVPENGVQVIYFDLQFRQDVGDDGILTCRAADPRIVAFSRRVSVGFTVEVGGQLCQDRDGRFYVNCCYAQFVRKRRSDAAKSETINTEVERSG
jgi:hypothetical protein